MLKISNLRIICIGKVKKDWIKQGINVYKKRMPGLLITELRDGVLKKEALSIKANLKKGERIILLSEKGEELNSTLLSKRIETYSHERLAFVVGGANGFAPELYQIATWTLSLSQLTFPHEIARLILVEQIYRAKLIAEGSPYHKD